MDPTLPNYWPEKLVDFDDRGPFATQLVHLMSDRGHYCLTFLVRHDVASDGPC